MSDSIESMIAELKKEHEIAVVLPRADSRPFLAGCSFALGFALAVAAGTLWALSLIGHDDGRDVALLILASFAAFAVGAHFMDGFERGRRD